MQSVAVTVSVCQEKGAHVFMSVSVVCQPAPEHFLSLPTRAGCVSSSRSGAMNQMGWPTLGASVLTHGSDQRTTQETWADNRVPDPG